MPKLTRGQEWNRVIAEHGVVVERVNDMARLDGRYLVVWSPEECESMMDLHDRLRELEGRGMA